MRESTIRTICVCFTLLFSGQAFAFSGGITGYSGNPAVTGDNAAIDRKAGRLAILQRVCMR
ncbi:MAG: hypothetical protein GY794_00465 [bacterium]|nr:hypothetical protein [bacterium]